MSAPPPAPPDRPFEPFAAPDAKLGERWTGHLFRRAGFGITPAWMDRFAAASPTDALGFLFDFDPAGDPFDDALAQLEGVFTPAASNEAAQEWWVHRMLATPRPLQERVALLWHGHFATSAVKVGRPILSHLQIDLFRRLGLGSFRDLLVAVGRDPAMLIWLDGQANKKGKPNENYAREVMELFTLGIGHYTEADIKELARAFTGWRLANADPPPGLAGPGTQSSAAVFEPKQFDEGEKEVFGKKGPLDSESAADLLLAQPAAALFLAGRLLREFVHPAPLPEHVEHVAARLREARWEIKPVLRELLASRLFFSDWAYRSRIKSPATLVIGALLALGGKPNARFAREQMTRMGQSLLMPPTVKGWDGEAAWINANTVLVRFNFGLAAATQRGEEFARKSPLGEALEKDHAATPEAVVESFARLLLDGVLDADERGKLVDYLTRDEKNQPGKPGSFALSPKTLDSKVRGLLHLMMAAPEYQLG